jgi:transglutaminase/protease-like cytokinesis protein 3
MKQLLFFFLLISFSIKSQDFKKVDEMVLNYPRFSKVEDLASKINIDFSTDEEKARAAFFWLSKNIRYNIRQFYSGKDRSYSFSYESEEDRIQKQQAVMDKLVADTFRNKTGVCEEYARSFKKICDLLEIKAAVITGSVRTDSNEIGNVTAEASHAWNAVFLNNKWVILDATWAAGHEYNKRWIREFNEYFYDIPTDKIFKTHFPEESIWILRFGRISKEEFYNQPIYTNTFLGLNTELISPTKGVINVNSGENIELKFKDLDSKLLISYMVEGNRYSQKPIITSKENITSLTIKNPERNTELVLFINNKDALHFKVIVN